MPINRKLEYTVLDMIESATRNSRAAPLNLGGFGGGGGGLGGPPGGFIGRLPQFQVTYDETEAATLDTLPSGNTGMSGWSLIDNLNHIRYRLGTLESGGSSSFSGIIVIDDNNSLTYNNIDTLHFVGSGVTVIDLGGGEVQIEINATGSGGGGIEEAPLTGDTYGRNNGAWVIISGGTGDVEEAPVDGNVYGRQNESWVVISGAVTSGEQVFHKYNDDLTSQVTGRVFATSLIYAEQTLRVYYNGIRQRKGIHYLDDVDFMVFSTYFDTYSGDTVIVDYDYYVSDQIPPTALSDSLDNLLTDSNGEWLLE